MQSIELAVAAEQLGADGAYFRVHHFARQLRSPFPLLVAVGAKTKRIEIGTAVIAMRYEDPALHRGGCGRRGSHRRRTAATRHQPRLTEQAIDGWRYFGYAPAAGETEADITPKSFSHC